MTPTPALDFLRKVEVWQHYPGGTAGLAVALPEGEDATLAGLLARLRDDGPDVRLETQARYWLVGYAEANPPLTPDQRAELDAIVTCIPLWEHREQQQQSRTGGGSRARRRVITAAVVAVIALLAGIGTRVLVSSGQDNSPPPAGQVQPFRQQPAPGGQTDLQRFRADWNVPAVAEPVAGGLRALTLLEDGLYYPAPWTVPAGDPGWIADSTGSVTASVHDGLADVTDSNGTTWTIAIGQPFALASNPQVVFRVLRDASVQSMPQPHAIRVRVPVTTK